ncbi:hypothetical protein PS870_06312 [Pseudomonas fluorescens]|uniref:Transmembrane protein n=1 Tax=Pseudomonas fluorescens TaxID=294 RepID=A0A5E7QJ45_PSEFL|nr:hypothetical protein [Pseudomonas fluorescens]VVP61310.1 hypothetical protein PS870_06312 [Pseudomonas fluorescens]
MSEKYEAYSWNAELFVMGFHSPFIVATATLIYLSVLLDLNNAPQLIFVFRLYLLIYLTALILMMAAWQSLHKLLAIKPLPAQKNQAYL